MNASKETNVLYKSDAHKTVRIFCNNFALRRNEPMFLPRLSNAYMRIIIDTIANALPMIGEISDTSSLACSRNPKCCVGRDEGQEPEPTIRRHASILGRGRGLLPESGTPGPKLAWGRP